MAFLDICYTSGRAKFMLELPAGAGPEDAVAPGVSLLDAVTAIYDGTAIVSANVKKVNSVTVTGTGAAGDEWGP